MSSDPMIQRACQAEPFLKELGLHGFAVFLDEIRSLSKAAADVHERDHNYYMAAEKRLVEYQRQLKLF